MLNPFATSCLIAVALHASAPAQNDQLQAEVERIEHDGAHWFAQRGDDSLTCTPNECFFDGSGLTAKGKGAAGLPGEQLNKGKSYRTITGFREGNAACWYVMIDEAGAVTLSVEGNKVATCRFECGEQRGALPATIELAQGVHCLRVRGDADTSVQCLRVAGPAAAGAKVLRARWRPAAAHTRFSSSTLSTNSKLWVMEMDAMPGDAGFYSPMTTPFGYFGSSWHADGRPKGLNFSMWSYGRGKQEPPIEQLSHLIAVGNPKMNFGGFGHEGTGVKPRGWTPFDEWQEQRVVYALRFEPGDPYDTYYGYYFDERTEQWQLYAAGRKRRGKRTPDSLWAGSFVEVPGPPQRQRTGHITRTMCYRGFQMDANRKWHALDRMKGEGKPGTFGNRSRYVTDDGRFAMSIGGMRHYGPNAALAIEQGELPDVPWLDPNATAALLTMPTTVTVRSFEVVAGEAVLDIDIVGTSGDTKVTAYFGDTDALTFAERWREHRVITDAKKGRQTLRYSCANDVRHVRVLVESENGRYWSF